MDRRTSRAALALLFAISCSSLIGCKGQGAEAAKVLLPVVANALVGGAQGGAPGGPGAPAGNGNPQAAATTRDGQLANLDPMLGAADRSSANAAGNADPAAPQTTQGTGSATGKRIADVAGTYVNQPFDYAAATNGGRLGCAQVVTTILKEAGATSNIRLGVLDTLSDLRANGWADVTPPPWEDGDVVTWSTYDRDGDGVKDRDTHIGIIRIIDGTPYAVNNSSSQRVPVQRELASLPWRQNSVLRTS